MRFRWHFTMCFVNGKLPADDRKMQWGASRCIPRKAQETARVSVGVLDGFGACFGLFFQVRTGNPVFQTSSNRSARERRDACSKYRPFGGFCSLWTAMSDIKILFPKTRASSTMVLQPSKSEGWTTATHLRRSWICSARSINPSMLTCCARPNS